MSVAFVSVVLIIDRGVGSDEGVLVTLLDVLEGSEALEADVHRLFAEVCQVESE
jgi:hypothetical protein